MERMEPIWIACALCNRGGNGNDKDKCSCGWQITDVNSLGCYLGYPIVGETKAKPKVSRSKKRYQAYLNSDSCLSFREYLRIRP